MSATSGAVREEIQTDLFTLSGLAWRQASRECTRVLPALAGWRGFHRLTTHGRGQFGAWMRRPLNPQPITSRPVKRKIDRMPPLFFQGRWYDHLPTPESLPVGEVIKASAPSPVQSLRQRIREQALKAREKKRAEKALRALRDGPQPTTTGKHQIHTAITVPHDLRPKCEVLREESKARPGFCACGCELIRDAAFDEHGNATGKLRSVCVVCESADLWEELDGLGGIRD